MLVLTLLLVNEPDQHLAGVSAPSYEKQELASWPASSRLLSNFCNSLTASDEDVAWAAASALAFASRTGPQRSPYSQDILCPQLLRLLRSQPFAR